jgi:hypothetical protein
MLPAGSAGIADKVRERPSADAHRQLQVRCGALRSGAEWTVEASASRPDDVGAEAFTLHCAQDGSIKPLWGVATLPTAWAMPVNRHAM